MNSFVVLSAILGATMAAPAADADAQLIAGHGLLGAGYAGVGLAGHGLASVGLAGHGLAGVGLAGHGLAGVGLAGHGLAYAAAAHAVPAVNLHAVHTTVPVAVPTATVHKTVQTHLVPQPRLVGPQVSHSVHHVPRVHTETKTSTHTT